MTQSKKIIAITGGIGSGKSTVANIIKNLNYPVFNCDEIYAQLLSEGVFNEVFLNNFGKVFNNDGTLNRKLLASIVFLDKNKLNLLNDLTHKIIIEEVFNRAKAQNKTCFVEVPLLFESNSQNQFDKVIVVIRSLNNRIKAVMERNNISEFDAKARINNQFDYENANLEQYLVINNDDSPQDLERKVCSLLSKI